VAGREGKRGECQTRLGLVWRETGAVRNARPSRGQAAAHPEEGAVERRQRSDPYEFQCHEVSVFATARTRLCRANVRVGIGE